MVVAAAAEVGGVDQGRAGGVELRHEGVEPPPLSVAWKGVLGREVRRTGLARDVGVARRVDGDAAGRHRAAAAEVGGVDEAVPVGVQLGDEGVVPSPPP